MYLRFIAPAATGCGTVTRAQLAQGPFGPANDLWHAREEDTPSLLAIRRELDWFNRHLPVPRRFDVKAKGRWWSDGICWFRDDAKQMIAHAFTLAKLIEDCGQTIDQIWTRDPGQILYRDHWQIVAKPERTQLH